jgi:hypothetical protein
MRLRSNLLYAIITAVDTQRNLRGHVLVPDAAKAGAANAPVEIRVIPTGAIRGRVVGGKEPIVGAVIQIHEFRPDSTRPQAVLNYVVGVTKTDEYGRFEFPAVEADKDFSIYLHVQGYTDSGVVQVKVAAGRTLELKPIALLRLDNTVSGIVVDPDGNPVEGATINASQRSGPPITGGFTRRPTGKDGRFTIRGVPNVPLTLMVYMKPPPDSQDRLIRFPARVEAEPGQTDVQIVLDPKLVRERRSVPAPAVVPTPAQVLDNLRGRRGSVENLRVEASWEEYNDDKPSAWEEQIIYRNKQGHIRVRYHCGPGSLESADQKQSRVVDEAYNGKFTVNLNEDPTRDRLGNPLKPDETAVPTNRYRSVMIYNHKFPSPEWSAAESHRNPFNCMDGTVISELSVLLAAGKAVTVKPVNGRQQVYELSYELDPKDDPHHLKHRVVVDADKGWVVTRHEQFFPDGKSGRLSTCDYRHGKGGLWVPTAGQFRNLWGKEVPDLDWRFKVHRVVVNDRRFDQSVFDTEVDSFSLKQLNNSVAGVVVDPDGNPVEGVSVRTQITSGRAILIAFSQQPTGKDGRFTIRGLPNVPLTLMAHIEPLPDAKDRKVHFPAHVEAQPGQTDVRIVLDPKLVRGKK